MRYGQNQESRRGSLRTPSRLSLLLLRASNTQTGVCNYPLKRDFYF
nr:MAG TPA: hypothetical protein [Caudoviricetes sp.]